MDKIAIASDRDRRELFQETARQKGLAPLIIEKDFWVCWTLKRLFALDDLGGHLIFKGGTSLSKIYRVIERFSEDIDLSIRRDYLGFAGDTDPEASISRSQQKRRVESLREACRRATQEIYCPALRQEIGQILGPGGWALDIDSGDPNVLLFAYPGALPSTAPGLACIRPVVKLEMGAGSDPYPIGSHLITPYAAEEFPQAFAEPSCAVTVLEAERTFWEKATLLHAYYHLPPDRPTPERLSRHYYDLMQLSQSAIGAQALANLPLLERVVAHKSIYFASNWAHFDTATPGTFHILPEPGRIEDLKRDYAGMREMFFREAPAFEEIMAALQKLERALNAQDIS